MSRKTLGCYKSPNAEVKTSLAAITTNAMSKATLISTSALDSKCTIRYYFSVFLPSVTYPMATTTIPEKSLTKIQHRSTSKFLNRVGYARTMPHAVVYGPSCLGGADFRHFYDEQGSRQMELVLKHFRHKSTINDHLRIALGWAQQMSGSSSPILRHPHLNLPHLEATFFQSLRKYLTDTDSFLELQDTFIVPLQRRHDRHLMDLVLESNLFKDKQICQINSCRMYLQVHTISDLSNARGTHMHPNMLQGNLTKTNGKSLRLETIQERPTTSTAWNTWRQACRLWCNTVTMRLHTSLGSWNHPSPQLRRQWKYNWDPTTRSLFIHTPTTITKYSRQANGRLIPIPTSDTLSLPISCFPVDCTGTRGSIQRRPNKPGLRRQPTPRTTKPRNFQKFLRSQPQWIRRLLPKLELTMPYKMIADAMRKNPSSGACDGSVLHEQGTFGWALEIPALPDEPRCIATCRGPAYGIPMDSYRAEAYGMLSLTVFLQLIRQYFNLPPQPTKIFCDNEALVKTIKKLTKRLRPAFANDTLVPSWDVIQAIHRITATLTWIGEDGVTKPLFTFQHVKGHQDDKTPHHLLSPEAKLNCRADELADQFQNESNHKHIPAPMIDGVHCHLCIHNSTVGSRHRTRIRDVRRHRKLKQYIQTKTGMDNATFQSVDWKSHENAVRNFKHGPHKFLVKFLHRQLPVGTRVSRYDPIKYTSACPSCNHPEEDFHHFMQCPDPERIKWQSTLCTKLRQKCDSLNTDPVLTDLLLHGLLHYLRNSTIPEHQLPPRFHPLLENQSRIGWDQFLLGRWSQKWTQLQYQYLRNNDQPIKHNNHGTNWVSSIIHLIWEHCQKEWKVRNDARHGKDADEQRRIRAATAQRQITSLYRYRPQCFPSSQTKYFYPTTTIHFQQEPEVKNLENWISTYGPMIHSEVRIRGSIRTGQRIIEDYFSPLQA